MRFFAASVLAATVVATDHGPTYGGSGPFKSYSFEVETLPNHTFYQPLESGVGSALKLPVIVWGNGISVGMAFRGLLGEVASHGALVIATGSAYIDPQTYAAAPNDTPPAANSSGTLAGENPAAMTAAIDWVQANAGKGEWTHVDATRIGTWGQSCGGLEAYASGMNDSRVNHLGIFNSGQLTEEASQEVAGSISKPVFYLLGGPTDVAYLIGLPLRQGARDYADLPATTPSWKGNHALGHSAAFDQPNGGIPGIVGSQIMQWVLRGNQSAKAWLTDGSPMTVGVNDVTFKNLDSIVTTPI
ncbi:hypothetical protein KVR01_007403 [Diaporthe batatas]|uniref:uncharacterized protein n=1 Tax=Diaporthe batatas TaxID=748121 RepID=UPI001D0458A5|nr:uncharacterized protein KVR01_007403 [Diaporthe batatas]KAG8162925.1 hypothetical protein KVR01_007403 [Diaporthe batatas]